MSIAMNIPLPDYLKDSVSMSAQVANPITWAKVHSLGKEVLDDLVSFIQLFDRIYLVSKPVTDAEAGEREFVVSVIGRDPHGYLGLGQKVTVVGQPTQLKQLNGVELVKIMAGGPNNTSRAFFVALDRTGRVWLWGSNLEGQVKPTQRGNHVYKPIELCLFMSKPIVDIAVGESHVLAMDSDGEIKAWGWNGHGQLGQGNVSRYTDVVTVFLDRQNVPPAKSIKAGGNRSMALSRFNRLYIWGAGQAGGRPIEVEFDSLPKEIGLAFTGKQEICLILDDEGKLLASAHPDDENDCFQLKIEAGKSIELKHLHVSPNGRRVVVQTVDNKLYRMDMPHGREDVATKMGVMSMVSDAFASGDEHGGGGGAAAAGDDDLSLDYGAAEVTHTNAPFMLSFEKFEEKVESMNREQVIDSFGVPEGHDFFFSFEDGNKLYVSTVELVQKSEAMKQLVLGDFFGQQSGAISAYPYAIFKAYLGYLYTETLELSDLDQATEMLQLAINFNEMPLRQRCIEKIIPQLDLSNFGYIYYIAKANNLDGLLDDIHLWIVTNFAEVKNTDTFASVIDPAERSFLMATYYAMNQDEN